MTGTPPTVAETRLDAGLFALRPSTSRRGRRAGPHLMNDPEVAAYWELAQPAERIAAYLREQVASAHSTPWIGCVDGVPMSY